MSLTITPTQQVIQVALSPRNPDHFTLVFSDLPEELYEAFSLLDVPQAFNDCMIIAHRATAHVGLRGYSSANYMANGAVYSKFVSGYVELDLHCRFSQAHFFFNHLIAAIIAPWMRVRKNVGIKYDGGPMPGSDLWPANGIPGFWVDRSNGWLPDPLPTPAPEPAPAPPPGPQPPDANDCDDYPEPYGSLVTEVRHMADCLEVLTMSPIGRLMIIEQARKLQAVPVLHARVEDEDWVGGQPIPRP